jgi:N-acetylmuramoyl-L-alanine amidase
VRFIFILWFWFLLLAQAQERYNTLVLEDTVLDGPYYFIAQGNSSDAFAKADVLAESFGFALTQTDRTLRLERGDTVITLETTSDISQGLVKRSDALQVNGAPVESPSAIVIGEDIYVAITPLVRAFGGDSQWFAADQTITLLREAQQLIETSSTEPTVVTLSTPRIGFQDGVTRVVLDLPEGIAYELYASDKTFVVKLPRTNVTPFQQVLEDANLESVRYAIVGDSTALVVTSRYALEGGKGYRYALLPAAEKGGSERFYIDFAPTLAGESVASAQNLSISELTTPQLPANTKTVVLDAGHGGEDPGTVSYAVEKEVTLEVTLTLKRLLEAQGIRVVLTRDTDSYPTLEERSQFASPNTNLFVSVHVNSAQNSSASGVETWVFGEPLEPSLIALAVEENGGGAAGAARTREALEVATSIEGDIFKETQLSYSEALARSVQRALIEVTQSADRGVKQNAWYVIRHARSPAILVELGFATNPDEGKRLTQADYQARLAQALAKGITTFLEGGGSVAKN